MGLRVISGEARGLRLDQPPRETTRPLTDRAREALGNIVAPHLDGARVADLFAGSGAVGIEALSRGAAHATFVELDRGACEVVAQNLERTGLADRATVVRGDALVWLDRREGPLDLVFVGPPQWQGLWAEALVRLDAVAADLLAPDGLVVSQCDPAEDQDDAALGLTHLVRTDQRRYGKVLLTFHALAGTVGPPNDHR